jgi:hypothetical protein
LNEVSAAFARLAKGTLDPPSALTVTMTKEQTVEYEKKPCALCNDTGFVMEAETDLTGEAAGKPDIFVPKPCPNGCLPPQK